MALVCQLTLASSSQQQHLSFSHKRGVHFVYVLMCENGICAVFTICLQFAIKKTVEQEEVVKKTHCQVHV